MTRTLQTVVVIAIFFIQKSLQVCIIPEPPLNGEIVYVTRDDDDVTSSVVPDSGIIKFQCHEDYHLVDAEVNLCRHGNWTSTHAQCARTRCRPLPGISNGNWVSLEPKRENSNATIVCSDGYEIVVGSSPTLRCVRRGLDLLWEGALPQCTKRVTCPDPGTSPNGTRVGQCCYAGDVIHFECNEGLRLIGDDELFCRADGSWNAHRPRCKPPSVCPDPPDILHGRIESGTRKGDFFEPWDEAVVACDTGYKAVNGSDFLYCYDDLTWDDEFAACTEIICDLPPIPSNGSIAEEYLLNQTRITFDTEVNFMCNRGYRLIGNSWVSCTENGWSHPSPVCQEVSCKHPGIPENGNIIGSSFRVGETVEFSCFAGFNLIGDEVRTCLSNGVWSGVPASCDNGRTHCPNPGVPQNGRKSGHRYEVKDVVKFSCKPGYNLSGPKVLQCQETGYWNGTVPKCEGVLEFERPEDVSFRVLLALDQNMVLQDSKKSQDPHALESEYIKGRTLNVNVAHNLVIYFVLDASKSVGEKNFNISLAFVKTLVRRIGVSPKGVRVGVMTYGSNVTTVFNPLELTNTAAVLKKLEDKVRYTKGGTATTKALEEIRLNIHPLVKAHLKNFKSVLFLISDGKFNMGGNPEVTATVLKKDMNFEIYCIGVTGNPNIRSLERLASTPENEHTFKLHGFDTLQWMVDKLLNGSVDYSRCGLSYRELREKNSVGARILGGRNVVQQWPWMAALYIRYPGEFLRKLRCGGSLIDRQWILTAAHCLRSIKTNKTLDQTDVIIKLGLIDKKNYTDIQEFEPALIIIHNQFNRLSANLNNDIALIKLNRPVTYTEHIRPVCLPPKFDDTNGTILYKANQNATTMGWGYNETLNKTEHAPRGVDVLKELSLEIQSKEKCHQSLKGYNITDKMFCAGDATGKRDTCEGDSGGPLMQSLGFDADQKWVQVGIVSWGEGCGQKGFYGVYTNVAKMLDWVTTTMSSH